MLSSLLAIFEAFVKLAQEKFAVSSWKRTASQLIFIQYLLLILTKSAYIQKRREKKAEEIWLFKQ